MSRKFHLSALTFPYQKVVYNIIFDCFEQAYAFLLLIQIKMAIHTYSGLFGTFLCNSELDRLQSTSSSQTCSIWAFLDPNFNWSIINYLYEEKKEVRKANGNA